MQGGQDFLCTPCVKTSCSGRRLSRACTKPCASAHIGNAKRAAHPCTFTSLYFALPSTTTNKLNFQFRFPLPSAIGVFEVRLSSGLGKGSYDRLWFVRHFQSLSLTVTIADFLFLMLTRVETVLTMRIDLVRCCLLECIRIRLGEPNSQPTRQTCIHYIC
jgi:hypothetical protein